MSNQRRWERDELLVAFYLYSHTPFGRISQRNPEIIQIAELMQRSASSLSMKMANIASCDPSITSTGRKGLPGASRADKAMWQEMTQDWETFYLKAYAAHQQLMQSSEPQNVKSAGTDDFHGREREALTKARIGQQVFRNSVLSAYDFRCCITGLDIPELLIASHIVPWSQEPKQRLNPSNGLCLSSLHDAAFDKGLITLNSHLELLLSPKLLTKENRYLSDSFERFENQPIRLPNKFAPAEEYLALHRQQIFQAIS
ncbi:HNH endonuclease [Shewanella algae]|uniref:HNH endonuclease n=1 Tax=Shewanella algae TaxID=38313 RepID=UPI0006CFD334|nr:HNH endonuclease [Shewanella algae]MBO2584280.1 HNH endonuclease [Shewanella algae]PSS73493.1 restriction endonuclease [Shewanella algae]